jgi:hypothetical protein
MTSGAVCPTCSDLLHRTQGDLVGEVHRLHVAFEGFLVTVLVLGEVDKDLGRLR